MEAFSKENPVNEINYLTCSATLIAENKMYVVSELLGTLLEYDMETWNYSVLARLELDDKERVVRVRSMHLCRGIIYIILNDGVELFEYDIKEKKILCNYLDLDYENSIELIAKTVLWKDELWIFPISVINSIYIYEINSRQCRKYKSIYEIIRQENMLVNSDARITYSIHMEEEKVWLAVYQTSLFILLDMNEGETNVYSIGKGDSIYYFSPGQNFFWVSFFNNTKVKKWSPSTGVMEEYEIKKVNMDKREQPIRFIWSENEKVYILPTYEPNIIEYDLTSREERVIFYSKEFRRIHRNMERTLYFDYGEDDKDIFFVPYASNVMIIFRRHVQKLEYIELKFVDEDIQKFYADYKIKKGHFIQEVKGYEIQNFLEYIYLIKNDVGHRQINGNGKKIYQCSKERIIRR